MSAAPILTFFRNGEKIAEKIIDSDGLLGRSDGCVVRLDDRAISRQHAALRLIENGLQIECKSDFAPLSVNGVEVTRALLRESDVISIGPFIARVTYPKPVVEAPKSDLELVAATAVAPPPPGTALTLQDPGGPGEPAASLVLASTNPGENSSVSPAGGMESMALESPSSEDSSGATQIVSKDQVKICLTVGPSSPNPTQFEMAGNEILIGRTKDCHLVINDKKSSRRHARIEKSGLKFVLRDLDTVNGTFLNGEKIKEAQLSGDDLIVIGETEIRFQVISSEYQDKQEAFASTQGEPISIQDAMNAASPSDQGPAEIAVDSGIIDAANPADVSPVPASAISESPVPYMDPAALQLANTPPVDMGAIPGATPGKRQSLVEKFRALPKKRQAIWAVIILGILAFLLFDEDQGPKRAQKTPAKAVAGQKAAPDSVTFDKLTADQKRFVETQYTLGFDLYKNKDYDKSLFEIRKIFQLVPDYKDAREIERYAQEGKRKLDALEDEKKKKEEADRIKARVAQLTEQGQTFMAQKKYDDAQQIFSDILELDPENAEVAKWKAEIQQASDRNKLAAENLERQKAAAKSAWKQMAGARALQKQEKYFPAISAYRAVIEMGAFSRKLVKEAKAAIAECLEAVRQKAAPLLEEAKQAEQSGDSSTAYRSYKAATLIDPRSREAYAGIERVRGTLHEHAKQVYTEAVLAESFSDFQTATQKYKECLTISPEDDIYHDRAKSKLKLYAPYGKMQENE